MSITPRDTVIITRHAAEQFADRCGAAIDHTEVGHRNMMVWAAHNGVCVGGQYGRDMLVHPAETNMDDVILVVRPTGRQSPKGGNRYVVVTVLTADHARANMQAATRGKRWA